MAQINFNKSSPGTHELIFPVLPVTDEISDSDILTLNIHGTVVPAISLGTADMHWQGGQFPMAMSPLTYEPWYVNFVVDSNWCNWYLLYRWITLIDDGVNKFGHSVDQYFVDATLNVYDNADNRVIGIKVANIYPTNLNEVSLSHREGSNLLECGVNFNYTNMIIDRAG